MKVEPEKPTASFSIINRITYAAFLLAGIAYLVVKDFSMAVIFWGLGLVFDPFDTKKPFPQRPIYQIIWLIVHLSITLALVVLMFMQK